ncbi:MAG TPA: DMT family transporter [Pseudonocardiaceae bacterium]
MTGDLPDGARPGGGPADRAAGIGLALVAGALLATQARINGQLGGELGDGVLAALVSFASGLLILVLLAVASPRLRAGLRAVRAAAVRRDLRWWQLIGGTSGAYLVACQGLTIGALGVAVFTVAVVAGQAVSGLVVDRAGLGPAGPQAITPARVLTAVGALAGVLVAVSGRLSAPDAVALAALPLLAGVALSWQQAVNGRVGAAAGGPMPATLVNFAVGTAVLVVVSAVDLAVRGLPGGPPTTAWLYVGGSLGIPVVALGVVAVRRIGVLLMGMATVAGQITAALLLDVLAPVAGRGPTAAEVLGCALALTVVVAAGVAGGRPARHGARMAP